MPKAVLKNGKFEINGLSLEDYLSKLERLRSDARALGLAIEAAVRCEPAAFVEFYKRSVPKKAIKVFVRCYELDREGELVMLYDFAAGQTKLELSTSMPHRICPPPRQIEFVYGMPGPTEMYCNDPVALRRYSSSVRRETREALKALGFPEGTSFELSYDHPPLESERFRL